MENTSGDSPQPSKRRRSGSQGRFNNPGQGRKISYSPETDNLIADHIRDKLTKNEKVTVQYVCTHAKDLICKENPKFNASSGWAHRFLSRHGIALQSIPRYKIKTDGEESAHVIDYKGRPLSYSPETDLRIADFVRDQQRKGTTVTNSSLRNYARTVIQRENPTFTASASWAQNFLLRHRLSLSLQQPAPAKPLLSSEASLTGSGSLASQTGDHAMSAYALLRRYSGEYDPSPQINEKGADHGASSQYPPLPANDPSSMVSSSLLLPQNSPLVSQSGPLFSSESLPQDFIHHKPVAPSSVSMAARNSVQNWSSTPPATIASCSLSLGVDEHRLSTSCRPLTYPRETDRIIAEWVKSKQQSGEKVTFSMLREHAKKLVCPENPNFTASVGWVTPFLLRHNIDLSVNKTVTAISLNPLPKNYAKQELVQNSQGPGNPSWNRAKLRHTLKEKYKVVNMLKKHNISLQHCSRILGMAVSTLSGWVKMVDGYEGEARVLETDQSLNNSELHYSLEKDREIAMWVSRRQQELGHTPSAGEILEYAEKVFSETENSMFTATPQWLTKFLERHKLGFSSEDKEKDPCVLMDQVKHDHLELPLKAERYLVHWIQQQVATAGKVSINQVYQLIYDLKSKHYPNFSISLDWLFKFLLTYRLQLDPKPSLDIIPEELKSPPAPTKRLASERDGSSGSLYNHHFTDSKAKRPSQDCLDAEVSNECVFADENSRNRSPSDVLLSLASPPSPSQTIVNSKAARDFTKAEKEEVVLYANRTTLQKAALKYKVAAPTVWRWRNELKLNSPRYTLEQKKEIIEHAEKYSAKEASKKYNISTKTIQNWRRMIQGQELPGVNTEENFCSFFTSASNSSDEKERPFGLADVGNSPPFDFIMLGACHPASSSSSTTSAAEGAQMAMSRPLESMMHDECGLNYSMPTAQNSSSLQLRWRDEEKLEILKYAHIHSLKVASERFGVPHATLNQWGKQLGVPNITSSDMEVFLKSPFTLPSLSNGQDQAFGEAACVQYIRPFLYSMLRHNTCPNF